MLFRREGHPPFEGCSILYAQVPHQNPFLLDSPAVFPVKSKVSASPVPHLLDFLFLVSNYLLEGPTVAHGFWSSLLSSLENQSERRLCSSGSIKSNPQAPSGLRDAIEHQSSRHRAVASSLRSQTSVRMAEMPLGGLYSGPFSCSLHHCDRKQFVEMVKTIRILESKSYCDFLEKSP